MSSAIYKKCNSKYQVIKHIAELTKEQKTMIATNCEHNRNSKHIIVTGKLKGREAQQHKHKTKVIKQVAEASNNRPTIHKTISRRSKTKGQRAYSTRNKKKTKAQQHVHTTNKKQQGSLKVS